MLFLVKRTVWTELVALVVLRALTTWVGDAKAPGVELNSRAIVQGVVGAAAIGVGDLFILGGLHRVVGRDRAAGLLGGLRELYERASMAAVLGGGVVAALGEEPLFRGVMLERLGVVRTALIFGAAHAGGRRLLGPAIWGIYDGLALGLVYRWSGSLAAAAVAHFVHDVVGGLWLKLGGPGVRA